jgi:hypothetical protein
MPLSEIQKKNLMSQAKNGMEFEFVFGLTLANVYGKKLIKKLISKLTI